MSPCYNCRPRHPTASGLLRHECHNPHPVKGSPVDRRRTTRTPKSATGNWDFTAMCVIAYVSCAACHDQSTACAGLQVTANTTWCMMHRRNLYAHDRGTVALPRQPCVFRHSARALGGGKEDVQVAKPQQVSQYRQQSRQKRTFGLFLC
jgi:hypothetical protein